jgi:hydroxyacylglutathione hydrolase
MNQAADRLIDFAGAAPAAGQFPPAWIHGDKRNGEPKIHVHHFDEHTVIMRQSKLTSYEAPFLFLLFGNDRALLLDTGASADPADLPLRQTVDDLIAGWLTAHPRESYHLVVAHTHSHGDHVAGDPQFDGRPDTTVISRELESVQQHFGLTGQPGQEIGFDLGGRELRAIATPGHHRAAITIYDPWTGFLLTGDTVLPGRLYAFDYPAFLASLDTITGFAARHTVTHVVGCHIEMTRRPGRDYPLGCTCQPDEPPLQLSVQQLTAIRDAAHQVAGTTGRHAFDDFIIYNEPTMTDSIKLTLRGLAWRLTRPFRPQPRKAALADRAMPGASGTISRPN